MWVVMLAGGRALVVRMWVTMRAMRAYASYLHTCTRLASCSGDIRGIGQRRPIRHVERTHLTCATSSTLCRATCALTWRQIGEALHWLPVDQFLAEVRRVLKPTGTLAIIGHDMWEINMNPKASEV